MTDITLGALGLTSLFNNCIGYFEYIQFGRSFEPDYQRCLLKVDIAKLRLCRWSKTINDYHRKHTRPLFSSEEAQYVKSILAEIVSLFAETRAASQAYETNVNLPQSEPLTKLNPDADLEPSIKQLHVELTTLAFNGLQRPSTSQAIGWALWKKTHFERLLDDITTLVNDLIALSPINDELETRCLEEVQSIEKSHQRNTIREVAMDIDPMLHRSIPPPATATNGHSYLENLAIDEALAIYGDHVSAGCPPIVRLGGNIYYANTVGGRSKTRYGDTYSIGDAFDI